VVCLLLSAASVRHFSVSYYSSNRISIKKLAEKKCTSGKICV